MDVVTIVLYFNRHGKYNRLYVHDDYDDFNQRCKFYLVLRCKTNSNHIYFDSSERLDSCTCGTILGNEISQDYIDGPNKGGSLEK